MPRGMTTPTRWNGNGVVPAFSQTSVVNGPNKIQLPGPCHAAGQAIGLASAVANDSALMLESLKSDANTRPSAMVKTK